VEPGSARLDFLRRGGAPLKDDVPYHDLGGDYFTRRADPQRIAKRLVAQLERLGHAVTLQTSTAQEAVAPPA
jgi:hypothetical protein